MNMLTALSKQRKENLEFFGPRACGVLVEANHGLFVVDPEDMYVSLSLLQHGKYAEDELEMFKTLVSKDSNVLVVGAHIGVHVIPLAKMCRTVIALEANPRTFELLSNNVFLNRCNNVAIHNAAASDCADDIDFLLNTVNSGGSKRLPHQLHPDHIYDNPETIKVRAIPLNYLSFDFDLVIMDIEGSEYFALKGMQKLLPRVQTLAIEFIPDHIRYVANVGVKEFSGLILPHFKHMFTDNEKYCDPEIALIEMFNRNENHNMIFFSK